MDEPPIKVLLIEDNPGDARLIQELLGESVRASFELACENRLTTGLERLAEGGIDVVLLDLSLPECRGLNTFRRAHAKAPGMPIVVLTGHDDETLAVTAVHEGAEDYLVKGQVDSSSLARSLQYAIERTRRRQAEETVNANRQEMRVARQIQEKLFPASAPILRGYDIGGASYTAEATGGDYFDFIPMLDDAMGIVIGDVSGHGVGPALLMAETRAYLRALAQNHSDVGQILERANCFLVEDTRGGDFVTLFYGRLDWETHSFIYASAGHPTGYILDSTKSVKMFLRSTAMPLGVAAAGDFPAAPAITLKNGDVLFLLTDGIAEARSVDNGFFGAERALDVIRGNWSKPAQEIVTAVYDAACAFSHRNLPLDDMTAVIIKVDDP